MVLPKDKVSLSLSLSLCVCVETSRTEYSAAVYEISCPAKILWSMTEVTDDEEGGGGVTNPPLPIHWSTEKEWEKGDQPGLD